MKGIVTTDNSLTPLSENLGYLRFPQLFIIVQKNVVAAFTYVNGACFFTDF